MDKRRTKSLDGKCGSCRFFTVEQGRDCTGFCSGRMKRKGRIERTYKCIGYEAAPTIIEAEEKCMSIYIHGMDMPTKENTVILISPNGDVWMIGDMPNEDTHLVKAKAVSVPKHGRLIDADALANSITGAIYHSDLREAPTIIPAEEGET